MAIPLYHVDAFTDRPFAGNPAAVCLLDTAREPDWMQAVARDMNLSETAFLVPRDGEFGLRWFTPAVEVALCGHATLASAHVLWETSRLARDAVARFHTQSGVLSASWRSESANIEMDFPATSVQSVAPPPDLLEALGTEALFVGKTRFDFLLELEHTQQVRALRPDFTRLRQLPIRGVIVTSRSDDARYDFVSRFFAPGSGIDEDPVTGSAHCALGPYWQDRLRRSALVGYQASARGGVVRVTVRGDRALLAGQAVTVARGELV